MAGVLHLIGTPIGNLGDITLRAVEVLRSVDRVVAEDTRRTRGLLSHLAIPGKPVERLDRHASEGRVRGLVERLLVGESIALVTDAGMPGISDPGASLVGAARAEGVEVRCAPGPSAVTTAVALSGLVEGPFIFLGFLSRHGEARRAELERIARTVEPVVLFEAPGRTQSTLQDLAEWSPERRACVAREMTKVHEESVLGTLEELAARAEWRGEVTIVLEGRVAREVGLSDEVLAERIRAALGEGRPARGLAAELAALSGRPRRELYAMIQRLKHG